MKELSPNSTLSHYRIVSKLGAGGMGEVYLAHDTKLDRKVALKVLPSDVVAANPERMRRFVHEAKAASALNHPNIITIHEIDESNSIHFIATEFIDGETLRRHMRSMSVSLGEVLDVATQIASALAAAHAAGIVHRDIKPENVMLRRDGIVKVLDFGLAKLVESSDDATDPEAATRAIQNTEPGVVMGTAIYMSPEQARGLPLDARTDIFSLGVLLYEMVTERLPFEGSHTNEILASILADKEPLPLARFARDVPHELERIVEKALRKNREQRYQTAKDMMLDLRTLKQRQQVEAEIERSRPPHMAHTPHTPGGETTPEALATVNVGASQTSSSAPVSTKRVLRYWIGSVMLIVAALGLSYFFYFRNQGAAIDSIAVLPFINESNDPNSEYLSDGITESIISNLSHLSQLKVMARSTVFHFKGKDIDPRQVGRQLGVQAVMAGRLLQKGDQLIVRTELVNVADGTELWGAEYDRKLSDSLSVQEDISREISERLRLKLTGDDKKRLTRYDTTDSEAYQFYLRGRYLWNKRTAEGLQRAIEQFQRAIERDPNYALGYVGLADSYALLEEYAGVPTSETLPKARAAVDRALSVDDSLAEAHTSSALIYQQMWRWGECEAEFRRAISLNPNYATAHHWFSIYLRARGRLDDSLKEIELAKEIDPLSPVINQNIAEIDLLKNNLNAAVEVCKRINELDPNFPGAHDELGFAYLKQHNYNSAIAEFQKTVELSGNASRYQGDLGYSYAVTGKPAEARAILKQLEEKYTRHEAIGQYLADVHAGLHEKDKVFTWLERDFDQRSGLRMPFVKWWFTFENVRDDPRYADLLHRMGLDP
jgi:serine/threonine protein kinase/Tfp pilus assembly protein PilF